MRAVQTGPMAGIVAQFALLSAVAATVGLGRSGWIVGIGCGVIANVLLAKGIVRYRTDRLGPASRVTLARATLVGGVAALTADSFQRSISVTTLVVLAGVALVLDAVDGWVARRTGAVSALGAQFDMEVDAFLMLVLSMYVARASGVWVLAIGGARYAFGAAGWLVPWMRQPLASRYWRKVVAATQGIVLTVAAADVLPRSWTVVALLASLALLAESFGRDVWTLWRGRPLVARSDDGRVAAMITLSACVLVWLALVAPNEIGLLTPKVFLRIPLEGLAFVALVLVLPRTLGRITAAAAGLVLGLLSILKLLDMAFFEALGRSFNPVTDVSYFGSATGLLSDSLGRGGAIAAVIAAGAVFLVLLVVMPLALLRLTGSVKRHSRRSVRGVSALTVGWVLCALVGAQFVSHTPIASTSASGLAYEQVRQVGAGIRDARAFAKAGAQDAFRDVAGNNLLTGLRGKDVVIAFVESYGKVALQGSAYSPQVNAELDAGTTKLQAAGFSSQSAWLTSPTFGGISWLAHSTLQSGLWINNQQRYNTLVATDRFTLSDAFKRAGWRTVADVPSNEKPWPEGKTFYHYEQIYDAHNVGYAGPKFSYASMPDQYILSAFQRNELAKPGHTPVMAEIDLVSSHTPWAPLPHLVDWNKVGDGSIFDSMPEQGQSPAAVWRDPRQVRAAYGQSIEYSLSTLISFVQTVHDNNLVLVVLGDHQPATIVSGAGASHDVPVTIIAHDPAVMNQISGWGWQNGLRPGADSPIWPMDAFRDRFLTAYGPHPPAK
ncbi:MAG: hypothetical protein QOK10_197 [Pseudonocardiales bacterium]|nr:hypothetical protein [Pseudonocardiales bacterium]